MLSLDGGGGVEGGLRDGWGCWSWRAHIFLFPLAVGVAPVKTHSIIFRKLVYRQHPQTQGIKGLCKQLEVFIVGTSSDLFIVELTCTHARTHTGVLSCCQCQWRTRVETSSSVLIFAKSVETLSRRIAFLEKLLQNDGVPGNNGNMF